MIKRSEKSITGLNQLQSKNNQRFFPGFFLLLLFCISSGPDQSLFALTSFPEWPGIGQCLPDLQREQLSLGGISRGLVRRPYFRRGMNGKNQRRYLIKAVNLNVLLS